MSRRASGSRRSSGTCGCHKRLKGTNSLVGQWPRHLAVDFLWMRCFRPHAVHGPQFFIETLGSTLQRLLAETALLLLGPGRLGLELGLGLGLGLESGLGFRVRGRC